MTLAKEEFLAAQHRLLEHFGVEARSRFVDTPILEGESHVLVAGEGPPVMMVIGGGMVAALWAPLMARLHGFTLYAVDPPGHGLTTTTRYDRETMRAMGVGFLSEVLDGLELGSVPFVSQSMGGLFTTWLAIEQPERVTTISYVSCPAVFLGSSAPLPLRLSTIRWLAWLIDRLDPPSPGQVERMARMAGEDLSHSPELRDVFLAYEGLPGSLATLHDLHRSLIRVRGAQPDLALTAGQLSEVEAPMQMIWGESDPFGPPSVGQRMAEIVPGSRLHVVPGGHGPWFSRSDVIAPLIDGFIRLNTRPIPGPARVTDSSTSVADP